MINIQTTNPRSFVTAIGILGLVTCCGFRLPPARAPLDFTTDNYELTFRIPAGSFRCSYPASFVGSDHGIIIYLTDPKVCNPKGPEAIANGGKSIPQIEIFYSFNIAEVSPPGMTPHPPKNNQELVENHCKAPLDAMPSTLRLFGSTAAGCIKKNGDDISLFIGALYSQDNQHSSDNSDSLVTLTLSTTNGRFQRDLKAFEAIAGSIQVCNAPDRPRVPWRVPCRRATR